MRIIAMACPQCGGSIKLQEGEDTCFCPYCGTELHVDDGTIRIEKHVYDEARLRELDLADRSESEHRALLARWKQIMAVWLAVAGGLIVVATLIGDVAPGVSQAVSLLGSGCLLFGGLIVYVLYPRQRKEATVDAVRVPHGGRSEKSRAVALALCIALGYVGAHRFYVRKYGTGALYLFMVGIFLFGWIADIVQIARGSFCDADGRVLS